MTQELKDKNSVPIKHRRPWIAGTPQPFEKHAAEVKKEEKVGDENE